MNYGAICAAVCLAAGMCTTAAAQDANKQWLGVWQSMLDGKPGVTVTLANDTGHLSGTIVLNMINGEGGRVRVIGSEAHVFPSPRLDKDTLTFELRKQRAPDETMDFAMVLKPDGTATIHCTNCDGAPVIELIKEW